VEEKGLQSITPGVGLELALLRGNSLHNPLPKPLTHPIPLTWAWIATDVLGMNKENPYAILLLNGITYWQLDRLHVECCWHLSHNWRGGWALHHVGCALNLCQIHPCGERGSFL